MATENITAGTPQPHGSGGGETGPLLFFFDMRRARHNDASVSRLGAPEEGRYCRLLGGVHRHRAAQRDQVQAWGWAPGAVPEKAGRAVACSRAV